MIFGSRFFNELILGAALMVPGTLWSQSVRIGAGVGGLGFDGVSSGIGFGPQITIVPYENLGLMLDATLASLDSGFYFSSSPSLVGYLATPEELKVGVFGGGGFYKIGSSDLNFGLSGGLLGDFMLAPNIFVGAILRYHSVFSNPSNASAWNVFLTFNFAFETSDGGW